MLLIPLCQSRWSTEHSLLILTDPIWGTDKTYLTDSVDLRCEEEDESQEKNEQIEIANSGNSIATSITWVRKQIEALSQLKLQNVKTPGISKKKTCH